MSSSRRRAAAKASDSDSNLTGMNPPSSATMRQSFTHDDRDEVELSLLTEDERSAAFAGQNGRAEAEMMEKGKESAPLSTKDWNALALLVLLCACMPCIWLYSTYSLQTSYRACRCVRLHTRLHRPAC